MGKGNHLKIGFVYDPPSLIEQNTATDCRVELFTLNTIGLKAKVIAEDIIAYSQLIIAEMSKNDLIDHSYIT